MYCQMRYTEAAATELKEFTARVPGIRSPGILAADTFDRDTV